MSKTITVKGVGSVSAKPDYIVLSLSVTARAQDYDRSMEDAAARIDMLAAAAQRAGFEKDALKTLSFRVNSFYESVQADDGSYRSVFAGYDCSYRLKLAFDFDSGRLSAVLSAIADSGAQPELSISFTVKEPAKVSEALLSSAAANARQKAEVLCRASGAELGELLTIDYQWNQLNVVSQTRYEAEDCVMPMMAKCRGPAIQPDDIDLHDAATFVWALA